MQASSMAGRCHRTGLGKRTRSGPAARAALAAMLLVLACGAPAADTASAPVGAEAAPLTTELLRPGLYRINGEGGGTLLRLSLTGVVVIDPQRAGSHSAVMAEIGRITKSANPVIRAVVLTSVEPGQAARVAPFADAGVPVLVQERAAERLAGQARARGDTPQRLVRYGTDYAVMVDDVLADVEHVGSGRTGADSVVHFRDLRVMAVGDLFTHGTPQPDCASGGSFAGWAAAINHFYGLDFNLLVPSRGAPVGKAELAAFKARLDALAERARSSPAGSSDCRP